jgi:RNA polymerase sigma factor (sigma-70 family)
MPEHTQFEALLVEHLDWIDRVGASICRRGGFSDEDAADFASWTKLKLLENDYAVLRKFRGDSAIRTYLTVVVAMLFRDYRVHRWGRWRPSAAATQRGRVAVRLETLVRRDGYRFDQAAESLRTARETTLSDRELAALLAELPTRTPLRPMEVGSTSLATTEAPESADDRILAAEVHARRTMIDAALARALGQLSAEDQVVVRMRFWEALTVADIARALGLAQKALYRRLDRALAMLRAQLERDGVSPADLPALHGEPRPSNDAGDSEESGLS